jgi:gamma-glutamylputrescine oxidase
VVGGGLAGLHTALALAEKGVTDVVVVDSSRIGWGSSGLSKGLAVAGVQVPEESLAAQSSAEVASKVYALSNKAQDRLRSLIVKYDIKCRIVPGGGLEGSIYPPDSDEVRARTKFI